MATPRKRVTLCRCGCGVALARRATKTDQKYNGSRRVYWSDACAMRHREEKARRAEETRAFAALKRRLRYEERRETHLAYLKARRAHYTALNQEWRARNPTASAEASRRWRQRKKAEREEKRGQKPAHPSVPG